MSTDRQIEANRANAQRSTGPRTPLGKSASRRNAIKHGLTGELGDVGAALEEEFDDRRGAWGGEIRPRTEEAHSALDRAVAASIRIERCEIALNALIVEQTAQARLNWDEDRRVEAATLFGRLAKDPIRVAARLATTRQGSDLLIQTWNRLGEALVANGDWSDGERSIALDLLGVPAGLRSGRTDLDPPGGTDRVDWLRRLASDELARLERRKGGLDELDGVQRQQAERGLTVLLSKTAALILRYERDAWRCYRESMKAATSRTPEPAASPPREPERRPTDVSPTNRARPETPEARQVAAGPPTIAVQVDRPIKVDPRPAPSPALNRHQRRALAATSR